MTNDFLEIEAATREEWERLQRADAASASAFYFRKILPTVVIHHRQTTPVAVPCDLLVSLMGFSPETTVLTTTLVQPRQLVVIASKSAERYCDQCVEFLTGQSLMAREMISVRMVDPTNHDALFVTLSNALAASSGRRLVDVTGGKKIMSAVAGYAAWSLGLPVCYLESRAYNEQMRRPEPGSEEIIVLEPPVCDRS